MTDEVIDQEVTEELPEETDFETAFDEMANKKEVTQEVEPEIKDPVPEEIKNNDDDSSDEEPKPVEEVDIYAGMDEATKDRFVVLEEQNKNLNHRLDSDAGRVSAFQRKINGLEKELKSNQTNSEEQPSTKQISEAMNGSDDNWDKFRKEYPEVANSIDERFDKMGNATQEMIDSTLAPVHEMQARAVQSEAQAADEAAKVQVTETFPEWGKAVQTKEFSLWLDVQPPGIQALADSDNTQDAMSLIGSFDDHLVASGQPTMRAVKTDPGPGVETKANSIAEKRKQQLSSGTTIKSKPSGINPGAEDTTDFENAFNAFAKKREGQRA